MKEQISLVAFGLVLCLIFTLLFKYEDWIEDFKKWRNKR